MLNKNYIYDHLDSKQLKFVNKSLLLEDYKICSKCKTKQNIKNFHKDREGYISYCKSCRINSYSLEDNLKKRAKKYNLSQDEVISLLKNNKCFICSYKFKEDKEKCIDHCHNKLKVRDILCHKCNTALGLIGDNIYIAKNIIKYLKKHQ